MGNPFIQKFRIVFNHTSGIMIVECAMMDIWTPMDQMHFAIVEILLAIMIISSIVIAMLWDQRKVDCTSCKRILTIPKFKGFISSLHDILLMPLNLK